METAHLPLITGGGGIPGVVVSVSAQPGTRKVGTSPHHFHGTPSQHICCCYCQTSTKVTAKLEPAKPKHIDTSTHDKEPLKSNNIKKNASDIERTLTTG